MAYLVAVMARGWDHAARIKERCWESREHWCFKKRSLQGGWEGETRKAVDIAVTESQEKKVASRKEHISSELILREAPLDRLKSLWFSNSDCGENGLIDDNLASARLQWVEKGIRRKKMETVE